MTERELQQLFPKMKPVTSAPWLMSINGCGLTVYGKRDFHADTGTYVKTWCLSLVFVPLLALKAYRVAPAQSGGWYFLGREPLSALARFWNIALLGTILSTVAVVQYNAYTSTPEYRAKVQMADAAKAVGEGRLTDAAKTYQSLVTASTPQADNAAQAMKSLMEGSLQQASLKESAGVLAAATQVARRGSAFAVSDVVSTGVNLVKEKGDADPSNAIALLDVVRPLVIDTRPIDERRLALLRKWAAAEPNNLAAIVPLASLIADENPTDAKRLLLPVKDQLGDGDGARVLGTILGREGDDDGAYALLWPYVQTRLTSLRNAEKAAEDTVKQIWDRQIELLQQNKAPSDFYAKYETASKDQQQAMVQEYVSGQMRQDPAFISSQENLEREAAVVPVALELGIVMLGRANDQKDPAQRTEQLQAAEQVFLAVGGIAGQSDAYRLSLGQVYYWLGKQVEGRKLFDEYLVSKGRAFQDLMAIASKLRQVGSDPDARALMEEAHGKATDARERNAAAGSRSVVATDLDDEIAWLSKCDTSIDPELKAQLAKAMGHKEFEQGRDEEAVRQYRQAIDAYASMPRSATTLNEAALAHYAIFGVTGDRKELDRSTDCFQQAVALDPSNTILLFNAGVTTLSGAMTEVIGNDIDLRTLQSHGSIEMLSFLHNDQASRDEIVARVKAHPGVAKGLSFLDKSMVLSPKSARSYSGTYELLQFLRDDAGLTALERRIRAANVDANDALVDIKDFVNGTKDKPRVDAMLAGIKRAQRLVEATRAKGGATAAVAIESLARQMMALDVFGQPVDVDQIVALSDEAAKLCPSAATDGLLRNAYCLRAAKDLCRADPSFDAFYRKYVRTVGTIYLVAMATDNASPFHRRAVDNPHVQRAVAMTRDSDARYPGSGSAFEWGFLRGTDPALATRVAESIRQTPRRVTEQSIGLCLRPGSGAETIESYWLMLALDRPTEAKNVLANFATLGIPFPPQP